MQEESDQASGARQPITAKPRRRQVGMPRRFSIGTAMILTALFAVVFSGLKTLNAPPVVFAVVALFVATIAVCQALLFEGKNPRKASIVVGLAFGALCDAAAIAALLWIGGIWAEDLLPLAAILPMVPLLLAAIAYVTGWFIAAIFLVRKEEDVAPASMLESAGGKQAREAESEEIVP